MSGVSGVSGVLCSTRLTAELVFFHRPLVCVSPGTFRRLRRDRDSSSRRARSQRWRFAFWFLSLMIGPPRPRSRFEGRAGKRRTLTSKKGRNQRVTRLRNRCTGARRSNTNTALELKGPPRNTEVSSFSSCLGRGSWAMISSLATAAAVPGLPTPLLRMTVGDKNRMVLRDAFRSLFSRPLRKRKTAFFSVSNRPGRSRRERRITKGS